MARVTVEDCVLKIPNRFELVMVAASRARAVVAGAQITVDRDNDKNPVVALREIADDNLNLEEMRDNLIKGFQKRLDNDENEEEITELMQAEAAAWQQRAAEAARELRSSGEDEDEVAYNDNDAEGDDTESEVDMGNLDDEDEDA